MTVNLFSPNSACVIIVPLGMKYTKKLIPFLATAA